MYYSSMGPTNDNCEDVFCNPYTAQRIFELYELFPPSLIANALDKECLSTFLSTFTEGKKSNKRPQDYEVILFLYE